MRRTVGIVVIVLAALGAAVGGAVTAGATEPRVLITGPWVKDDTIGDASRAQGDLRKVEVANGRQNVTFTFRMQAKPVWDTFASSRSTFMRFRWDWQGTGAAYDRQLSVSYSEGDWRQVIRNGNGDAICLANGGVQNLGNNRYRVVVPTNTGCLGGARVLRVAAAFLDDRDDSAADDIRVDSVPNSGGYGPFIRLPA